MENIAINYGDVPATLAEVEKKHILYVYGLSNNNKSVTARRLDIGIRTLQRKLKQYEAERIKACPAGQLGEPLF